MQDFEIALDHLRTVIAGAGEGGGRIEPERRLASRLNVSRRAVRRALDRLAEEGRLTRRQGRGTFIGSPVSLPAPGDDPLARLRALNNPIDIIEVRLTLEPTLARLAAMRASQGEIDRLLALAEETRVAPTPKAYERADAQFHERVAAAARNPVFQALFEAVMSVVREATWRQGRETGHCVNNQATYAQCHREIAAAIAARDGDLAQERMRAHLGRVQGQLLTMVYPVSETGRSAAQ